MKFDILIIGAGASGMYVADALQKAGKRTAVIGSGRSINEVEVGPYERLGGTLSCNIHVRRRDQFGGGMRGKTRVVTSESLFGDTVFGNATEAN